MTKKHRRAERKSQSPRSGTFQGFHVGLILLAEPVSRSYRPNSGLAEDDTGHFAPAHRCSSKVMAPLPALHPSLIPDSLTVLTGSAVCHRRSLPFHLRHPDASSTSFRVCSSSPRHTGYHCLCSQRPRLSRLVLWKDQRRAIWRCSTRPQAR